MKRRWSATPGTASARESANRRAAVQRWEDRSGRANEAGQVWQRNVLSRMEARAVTPTFDRNNRPDYL